MDSPLFDDREKAAILWAEHVTLNTAKARDDVFEEVQRQYSPAEVVELTMVITYFNMRNRFQDALRIPLEEDGRVESISDSRYQDPDDMRAYIAGIAENWPGEFPRPRQVVEAPAGDS
jgi:hypothetical protein